MPGTTELIDFRRAFVWLLCGMLLPSVALVAFGVVAVVNERAAVERRLEMQYGARLRTLDLDVQARLDAAAASALTRALAEPGTRTGRPPSRRDNRRADALAAVQVKSPTATRPGIPTDGKSPTASRAGVATDGEAPAASRAGPTDGEAGAGAWGSNAGGGARSSMD